MRIFDFSNSKRVSQASVADVVFKNELADKVMCDVDKSNDGQDEAKMAGHKPSAAAPSDKTKKKGQKR